VLKPAGLTYQQDFLTPDEEAALLAEVETYPFHEITMRGQTARRTVIHFGWDYDYDGWKIHPTTPAPPSLRTLADRAAAAAGVPPDVLEQFLVARYPPGATIGWHRDAPMFGSPVIGVSLASPCTMKFRRKAGEGFEEFRILLEPRSLYILDGAARTQWQHSIPAAKELRYSISMRTLRKRQKGAG
jgi:alkylated DNA repair protein (DNA oxidative demethylase)